MVRGPVRSSNRSNGFSFRAHTTTLKLLLASVLACAFLIRATPSSPAQTNQPPPNEALRNACIKGRRLVCGRVMKIVPDGLIVESGYTNLVRAPLTQSWLAPATVSARLETRTAEVNEPGSACFGLILLTDIPKRPAVNQYDYVIIQAYPAGQYSYVPVPPITKTIRRFSAGLETAVKLSSK
jgi:hypothetical protein